MASADPLKRFLMELDRSLDRNTFARLTLTQPTTASHSVAERITARIVDLKGRLHLSLISHVGRQDFTRNLPLDQAASWLASQIPNAFRSALLATTERDWQLSPDRTGVLRLARHQPSTDEPPTRRHDRPKATLLDPSATDWLAGLGITDAGGKIRSSAADKHRQISRYLEILSHLVAECGWTGTDAEVGKPLSVADMGCGKGHLTFGAWHLLHRQVGRRVRILGVESRPELVKNANSLARALNAEGLSFEAGTIASVHLESLDALVALHACDTATDDSVARGIELGARLIIVAPCCHREVRPQLRHPPPLEPVLRHGIMEERLAEWLTDGLRGLYLEWAGYRTKLFEFVSSEHTPKNLMIAAVRERPAFSSEPARRAIIDLKAHFGIEHHALDPLLDRMPAVHPA